MKKYILLFIAIGAGCFALSAQDDPYLWLEEVDGAKALEFADRHSKAAIEKLSGQPEYPNIYTTSLEIYNSTDRIIYPAIYGEFIYNLWQDTAHVRGIWRRTPKQRFINGNPEWETLIDLDDLSEKDGVKWVFKGASGLYPEYRKFLVYLSKGGGDAIITREFDATEKDFVENGFFIDESKGSSDYLDENTLVVSSDFGKNTMTSSGYPKQVRIWKKGTPLHAARLIHEGEDTDVSCGGYLLRDGTTHYTIIRRNITFYSGHTYVWKNNKAIKLDIPDDSRINALLKNQLVLSLKSDWNVNGSIYKQGSLVSLDFTALLNGRKAIRLITRPDEYTSVSGVSTTQNRLLVNLLTNVMSELYSYSFTNHKWESKKVNAPDMGTISLSATDEFSDGYFFSYENFLIAPTLYVANASDNTLKSHQSLPAYFNAANYKVVQHKAISKDGTLIPYFVVSSKTIQHEGKNPTLLYAYGGFEIAMRPVYSGILGNAWLEQGGVYVLANIRGGGEFGPRWHQAGLKEKRQHVYDDFHAVAEDLIARKITSSRHLGIMGRSNGGLLVGVAFTQRPDLYGAVVCGVPLLDMQRYNRLLAGASWMGEYGNPDKPEEWEYIKKYSPYHNLEKGMNYPELFFYTSTRDDRVHPGHARKMAAKMLDMGHPVLYYENTEGGHAGTSTNEQRAQSSALQYSYLLMKLRR